MCEPKIVQPRKLVHSGKKRSYPSSFVWDCLKCGSWNIWQTKRLLGKVNVICHKCFTMHILDKNNPDKTVTRTKDMKSIID